MTILRRILAPIAFGIAMVVGIPFVYVMWFFNPPACTTSVHWFGDGEWAVRAGATPLHERRMWSVNNKLLTMDVDTARRFEIHRELVKQSHEEAVRAGGSPGPLNLPAPLIVQVGEFSATQSSISHWMLDGWLDFDPRDFDFIRSDSSKHRLFSQQVVEDRIGWPWLSWHSAAAWITEHNDADAVIRDAEVGRIKNGVNLGPPDGHASHETIRILPYAPRWRPLALNFLVFALPFAVLQEGYFLQRTRRRKRLGACLRCGYQSGSPASVCPECGLAARKGCRGRTGEHAPGIGSR